MRGCEKSFMGNGVPFIPFITVYIPVGRQSCYTGHLLLHRLPAPMEAVCL